jgi:hypothetical protein
MASCPGNQYLHKKWNILVRFRRATSRGCVSSHAFLLLSFGALSMAARPRFGKGSSALLWMLTAAGVSKRINGAKSLIG